MIMRIKINKSILTKLLIVFMSISIVGCKSEPLEILFVGDEYENIMQYLNENSDRYSSFIEIVKAGQMEDMLSSYNSNIGGSGYTLFLPDNEAVDKFVEINNSYSSFSDILQDTEFSKELVKYHVVNRMILSDDFPNGALPYRTLSEDFLTVKFTNIDGQVSYLINDESGLVSANIELSNGVIHLIDQMLSPVIFTAYEWVLASRDDGYSIFAQMLEESELEDTLTYFEINEAGIKEYNEYTMFIESDELYRENGINSFDDLVEKISPDDENYSSMDNELNKYLRYHIVSEGLFLERFANGDKNILETYGEYPISVSYGLETKFNVGTEVFENVVSGNDTTEIDYLLIDVDKSNILTKTGPVHQFNRLLKPFLPERSSETFTFINDRVIGRLTDVPPGTYRIHKDDLTAFTLEGTDYLYYVKEGSRITGVRNEDYIAVGNNFSLTYTTPRVLAGTYKITLIVRGSPGAADIITYVDGLQVGSIHKIKKPQTKWLVGYKEPIIIGNVSFEGYESHEINFEALFSGVLYIDRVILNPVN